MHVVFHASGETGAGVFRAARETGRLVEQQASIADA
jgi:hypothetical protein